MSGGTWDYTNRQLAALAETVRSGVDRHDEPLTEDLSGARAFAGGVLDELHDLLVELDHHFAGDSTIDSEQVWLAQARTRLSRVVTRLS